MADLRAAGAWVSSVSRLNGLYCIGAVVWLLSSACSSAAAGATEAQLAHARDLDRTGALLFERHCQSCHGPSGEGSDEVPAVLGRTTLSESRFRTAQDLWDYVAEKMPKDNPGGLDITQYWEVVTFMVASTGRRKIPDDRLSEANASKVRLRGE